ncbi:hypothetical protein KKI95_18405 [Xenorhabdus bovienii]|uniref:STY1053 family phage-associated protein n=1 Tax=Xenorhabdus bovienii TaxID=40576 RepID=UPI0023B27421|nr:hypothetical protein [Xenorhabdus bovienii]MDE9437841.1 hypothetical protein [Xenorhabdus bovienii]
MKIRAHTAFKFTHDNGETQDFVTGVHEVSEDVAQHWFVQAHAEIIGAVEDSTQADHETVIAEFRASIAELTQQLAEHDTQTMELKQQLAERDTQTMELKQQLEERDTQIAELMISGNPQATVDQTANGGKNGGNKK